MASPSGILSVWCSCAAVRPAKYRHEKPTQLSVRRGPPMRLEVTNAAAITFECVMLIVLACAGSWTDDGCVDIFAQLINGVSLHGGRGVVVLRVKGMTKVLLIGINYMYLVPDDTLGRSRLPVLPYRACQADNAPVANSGKGVIYLVVSCFIAEYVL